LKDVKDVKDVKEVKERTNTGPLERFFYDEMDEATKKKVLSKMSEKQKSFQQAAYELLVTEEDHIRDMKIVVEVRFLFYFILFYFILFYFILFYFILFYFILFYFILFYFILFYFILFYFSFLQMKLIN
jgi:hypothetical protein